MFSPLGLSTTTTVGLSGDGLIKIAGRDPALDHELWRLPVRAVGSAAKPLSGRPRRRAATPWSSCSARPASGWRPGSTAPATTSSRSSATPPRPASPTAARAGSRCRIGDGTGAETLRAAGIADARHLIAVCGEDGRNLAVATAAEATLDAERAIVLSAFIHVLLGRLRGETVRGSGHTDVRLEFFSAAATGVRLLLERHPPFEMPHGSAASEPRSFAPHRVQQLTISPTPPEEATR